MSKRATSHSGGIRSEAAKNRRVVFKNVLDTPFNIQWPEVKGDECTIVLDMLCEMLVSIREYRSRDRSPDKVNTDSGANKKSKKRKRTDSNTKEKPNISLANANQVPPTTDPAAPPVLAHTFIGINSVTRLLEKSIQNIKDQPPPAIVFVCKGDLAPVHLYSHLATMVALLPSTLLFPLPKGAEAKLSTALGLRAVGAIGLKAGNREVDDIVTVSSRMVQPLTTSWLPKITPPPPPPTDQTASSDVEKKKTKNLAPAPTSVSFEHTKIKSVQTTAPIVSKNDRTVKPKKDGGSGSTQKESQSGPKGQSPGQKGQQAGRKQEKGSRSNQK